MPTFAIKDDEGRTHFVMARCDEHKTIPPLNDSADGIAECGGCLGEDTAALMTMLFDILDGYADRLTHHCQLKAKLASARDRLNLMAPGAGDLLDVEEVDSLDVLPPLE